MIRQEDDQKEEQNLEEKEEEDDLEVETDQDQEEKEQKEERGWRRGFNRPILVISKSRLGEEEKRRMLGGG